MKDNYHKEYYIKNKEKIKLSSNLYYHSGKGKEVWNKFIQLNREHYNKYHRVYERNLNKSKGMEKKKERYSFIF